MSGGMCVGLDIGFGNCKVVFGRHHGQERTKILPVGAGPRSELTKGLYGDESRAGHSVLIDKEEWVAGVVPSAFENHVRNTNEKYVASKQYRALLYAALAEVGVNEIDCLVTGLPVSQYQEGMARRQEVINVMQGTHYIWKDKEVTVREVKVLPQPVGAYFDALATHEVLAKNRDIYLLAIDPGYFSVDYATVNKHGLVETSSGSSNLATSVVLEDAAEAFSRAHGHRVFAGRLEEALRTGKTEIMVGLTPQSFQPQLDTAARKASEKVLLEIANNQRTAKYDIDAIVLCGGGSSLYAPAVSEAFGKVRIFTSTNPVAANARGFFLAGEQYLKKRQAA